MPPSLHPFRPLLLAVAVFPLLSSLPALAASDADSSHEVKVAANAFSLGDPAPAWVTPVALPPLSTSAPLTEPLMDTQAQIGATPVTYVHRALQVNDASLLGSAGQLEIGFFPQYQHLHLHSIHIVRDGKVLDRTQSSMVRFLQRETALEMGEYNGAVTASILVNDLRVGDVVETAYSTDGENPVFDNKYFNELTWDREIPIAHRHISLRFPADRPLHWQAYSDSKITIPKPEDVTRDGWRTLSFDGTDLPALTLPKGLPADYTPTQWLQVSEYPDWNAVARWADALFQHDAAADEAVAPVVARIRKEHSLPADQVVAALDFVESNIRYFSVSLGESSFRPTPPNEVLQRSYGDCKDKTLLLHTLLDRLGIESHPVLLNNGIRHGLDLHLPSPDAFDHAILQVRLDGKTYYLDPTLLDQRSPLDKIGKLHIGEQVLVVARDTKEIIAIPDTRPAQFVDDEEHDAITLKHFDDDAQLTVKNIFRGEEAEYLRVGLSRSTREQRVQYFTTAMQSQYPGATLTGGPDIDDNVADNAVTIVTHYTVPKYVRSEEDEKFFSYSAGNLGGTLRTESSQKRDMPLALSRFPYRGLYTLEAELPDSVSKTLDPLDSTVTSKFFSHKSHELFRGNRANVSAEISVLTDRIAPRDFTAYLTAVDKVRKAAPGYFAIAKDDIHDQGLLGLSAKDYSAQLRSKLEKSVSALTTQIESGRLSGEDLASSYCGRAGALADLDRHEDAIHDVDEANRLAPRLADVKYCRGDIFYEVGQFPRSVSEYSAAIGLGASDELSAFWHRGVSRYFDGQTAAAAEDLLKAEKASGDEGARRYLELWLSFLLPRVGKPIPDEVVKIAHSDGDWPRPVLRVLNGTLSEQAMLATLEKTKHGDELRLDQTEAYFYLGEYHLGKGEPARAREYFEKARALDVFIYSEYMQSRFELERLEKKPALAGATPTAS